MNLPCDQCVRECDDKPCWMFWYWYGEKMEEIRKMLKVCPVCGSEYDGNKFQRLCTNCQEEQKKIAKQEYHDATSKPKIKPMVQVKKEPKLTLSQYNRMMREKGLTYGGKPIVSAAPLAPKFMEGHWPVKGDRS